MKHSPYKMLCTIVNRCSSVFSSFRYGGGCRWWNEIISSCSGKLSMGWYLSTIRATSVSANQLANFFWSAIVGLFVLFFIRIFSLWSQYNWRVWNGFLLIVLHTQCPGVFHCEFFETTKHFEFNPTIWRLHWDELVFVQRKSSVKALNCVVNFCSK